MLLPQETVLVLPKTNPNIGGVHLSSVELTFMYHLYIHRSMPASVIHELLVELHQRKPHRNAITNRLRRLLETKILIRDEESIGGIRGGIKRYQYRLTKRGYNALADLGLVNREDGDKYLAAVYRLQAFSMHNRSATMLANRIGYTCFKEKELQNVTFHRGSYHPYINQGNFLGKSLIVPDYVFEHTDIFVCIENDTGSQRGGILKEKFERYQELARSLYPRKLHIVFSVVDDSLFEELGEEREKRIASIKQAFPSSSIWEDNLQSFVVSAKEAPFLVKNLLLEKSPLNLFERQDKVDSWLSIVRQQLGESFEVQYMFADDLLLAAREKSLDSDGIVRLKRWDGAGSTISVVFAEQGSIRDQQVVKEQVKQMEMLKERYTGMKNVQKFRVLILYETEEDLAKDVRRLPVSPDIFVASIDSWIRWSEGESYKWYTVNSPYRLKERAGFEL